MLPPELCPALSPNMRYVLQTHLIYEHHKSMPGKTNILELGRVQDLMHFIRFNHLSPGNNPESLIYPTLETHCSLVGKVWDHKKKVYRLFAVYSTLQMGELRKIGESFDSWKVITILPSINIQLTGLINFEMMTILTPKTEFEKISPSIKEKYTAFEAPIKIFGVKPGDYPILTVEQIKDIQRQACLEKDDQKEKLQENVK